MKRVSKAVLALIPERDLAHIQRVAKRRRYRQAAFSNLGLSLSKRISSSLNEIGGVNAHKT